MEIDSSNSCSDFLLSRIPTVLQWCVVRGKEWLVVGERATGMSKRWRKWWIKNVCSGKGVCVRRKKKDAKEGQQLHLLRCGKRPSKRDTQRKRRDWVMAR
jgi:hypothetical protein